MRILGPILVLVIASVTCVSSAMPNFVLVLTDDLDLTLGGAATLTKTRRLIASEGAELAQWFVHTPVCCPSRAELLTGKMFHNLKEPNASGEACMYVNVQADLNCSFYSQHYFARHFKDMDYTVGVFGKHLNNYNVREPPPGVDRWFINGGGSYLNSSFVWASAGVEPIDVRFDNCTSSDGSPLDCYSTSIIGNASISWITDHVMSGVGRPDRSDPPAPFFAYVSVKAPHIQDGPGFPMAVPAPWYRNASVEGKRLAPRTPNYNSSCPDHHWLVRQQPPLTELESSKVDELYISRLRSLLSVDDLVEELIESLDNLGVLENTFILFTSDNGYRLGQFRMPQGKFHTYENDIRVPMFIRGPGIRPGSIRHDILGTHVDIMPTLLSLAAASNHGTAALGETVLSTMDGENLAPLLLESSSFDEAPRRNIVLIEYIGLGPVVRYSHLEDSFNNTFRTLRLIDPTLPEGWQNIKYVEFTDCKADWNFTEEPRELEMFDLAVDPFEISNIVSRAPGSLVLQLRKLVRQLFTCSGESCRGVVFPPLPPDLSAPTTT